MTTALLTSCIHAFKVGNSANPAKHSHPLSFSSFGTDLLRPAVAIAHKTAKVKAKCYHALGSGIRKRFATAGAAQWERYQGS